MLADIGVRRDGLVGTAFYIALEDDDGSAATEVDGKAIARASDRLDAIADELGVTPLMAFFSTDFGEMADLLGMEQDIGDVEAGLDIAESGGVDQWFDANDGLTTVRALARHLADRPASIARSEAVLSDLADFERILSKAAAENRRWHLSIDI